MTYSYSIKQKVRQWMRRGATWEMLRALSGTDNQGCQELIRQAFSG